MLRRFCAHPPAHCRVPTEQFHGCPFRHWNETQLRRELQKPRLHPAVCACELPFAGEGTMRGPL